MGRNREQLEQEALLFAKTKLSDLIIATQDLQQMIIISTIPLVHYAAMMWIPDK